MSRSTGLHSGCASISSWSCWKNRICAASVVRRTTNTAGAFLVGWDGPVLTRNLPIDVVRRCYAEEVRFAAGLRSEVLAEDFAAVPREDYSDPGPWRVQRGMEYVVTATSDPRELYHDVLIAIDPARRLNNGHPSSLAGLIDMLDLHAGDRVFHLACGLG